MGNTHQTPLCFHLLKPSQVESAEAHVLFDDAEDWLHFGGAGSPQTLSDLTGEVGSGLAVELEQAQANEDPAVAFWLGTLPFERALAAAITCIQASIGNITVLGYVAGNAWQPSRLAQAGAEGTLAI